MYSGVCGEKCDRQHRQQTSRKPEMVRLRADKTSLRMSLAGAAGRSFPGVCGENDGATESDMYEVYVFIKGEWHLSFSSMDWGEASRAKWEKVKVYGCHYVDMVYASIV